MKIANTLSRQPSFGEYSSYILYHGRILTILLNRSIMKARKTMKNQGLIQEVISQISQRFSPKIPDIKKVGSLIFKFMAS